MDSKCCHIQHTWILWEMECVQKITKTLPQFFLYLSIFHCEIACVSRFGCLWGFAEMIFDGIFSEIHQLHGESIERRCSTFWGFLRSKSQQIVIMWLKPCESTLSPPSRNLFRDYPRNGTRNPAKLCKPSTETIELFRLRERYV